MDKKTDRRLFYQTYFKIDGMQRITSVAELKNAIVTLESERDIKGSLLKEQVLIAYDRLRPVNLIKDAMKELFSTSIIDDDIIGKAASMAGGYLIKKLFVGKSKNSIRKLLGSILQFGISNLIVRNSDTIKSIGLTFIKFFTGKAKAYN